MTAWVCLGVSSWAQTSKLESNGASVPVVSFDFVWDSNKPPHYAIAVDSTGTAAYRSDESVQAGSSDEPYLLKFVVDEPTRSKIFELAKEANYFKGDFDYTRTRIANTGTKTLTFTEGHLPNDLQHPVKGVENQASYNWSQNLAIQQLTKIFQDMSYTIELGRTLDFKRRFDKLGLDAELKFAEGMQKNGDMEQVQVIAPVLKKIANDYSVMHIARERAQHILDVAGLKNGSAAATAPQSE